MAVHRGHLNRALTPTPTRTPTPNPNANPNSNPNPNPYPNPNPTPNQVHCGYLNGADSKIERLSHHGFMRTGLAWHEPASQAAPQRTLPRTRTLTLTLPQHLPLPLPLTGAGRVAAHWPPL